MAEKIEELGIPMRPARPVVATPLPARVSNPSHANSEAPEAPGASSPKASSEPAEPRTMIVGHGISLSGDIKSCNRLVVEGSLDGTLHDCGQMQIAEGGHFKGDASVEQGEVSGQFEGELVVSNRLSIRATGHVSGTITYGQIEIERGGKISGKIQAHQDGTAAPNFGVVRAGE